MLPVNHVYTTFPCEGSLKEPILNKFSENIRLVTNRNSGETEQTYPTSTDKEIFMPSTSFSSLQPLLNPTEMALLQKDTYGEMKMHTSEYNVVPGRIKRNALSIFNPKSNQLLIEQWEKWAQKAQPEEQGGKRCCIK